MQLLARFKLEGLNVALAAEDPDAVATSISKSTLTAERTLLPRLQALMLAPLRSLRISASWLTRCPGTIARMLAAAACGTWRQVRGCFGAKKCARCDYSNQKSHQIRQQWQWQQYVAAAPMHTPAGLLLCQWTYCVGFHKYVWTARFLCYLTVVSSLPETSLPAPEVTQALPLTRLLSPACLRLQVLCLKAASCHTLMALSGRLMEGGCFTRCQISPDDPARWI